MKMSWVLYSVIAAICFSGMILLYKKLLLLGINQLILNLSIFALVLLGFVLSVVITKTPIKLSYLMIILLVLAAVFSYFGNFLQVKAYADAPNPGYVNTIVSTQLILITILSVLFYKSDFTWIKFIGIVLVIFGSYLVGK